MFDKNQNRLVIYCIHSSLEINFIFMFLKLKNKLSYYGDWISGISDSMSCKRSIFLKYIYKEPMNDNGTKQSQWLSRIFMHNQCEWEERVTMYKA